MNTFRALSKEQIELNTRGSTALKRPLKFQHAENNVYHEPKLKIIIKYTQNFKNLLKLMPKDMFPTRIISVDKNEDNTVFHFEVYDKEQFFLCVNNKTKVIGIGDSRHSAEKEMLKKIIE